MSNIGDAVGWALPWWSAMVGINIINFSIMAIIFFKLLKKERQEPENRKYLLLLRISGAIYVSVALYRSAFVSSYPDRLVWFDTLFNSPFIIRCMACFAEMSFIGIIAAVLLRINRKNGILEKTPYVAVGCIFIAQFFAFTGLITQYNTLFAIEELLWACAFLSITPLVFIRLMQAKRKSDIGKNHKFFLIVMAVWCVGYTIFQWAYALPFIYFADLSKDAGRIIPPDALRQAIFNFTATRDFDAWGGIGFFIWHSGYFSICVWMVLLFISTPLFRPERHDGVFFRRDLRGDESRDNG